MTDERSADAPVAGEFYRWSGDPSLTIEVLSIGRKNAQIRVTQIDGVSWIKPQPMPFPDSLTRTTPPEPHGGTQ